MLACAQHASRSSIKQTVSAQRKIQRDADALDKSQAAKAFDGPQNAGAVQAGMHTQPEPPFPEQTRSRIGKGADVAIAYLSKHGDAEDTKRCVEAEGKRCTSIAGNVRESGVLPGSRTENG